MNAPLAHSRFDTPVGALRVVCDDQGRLRALEFTDRESRVRRWLDAPHVEGSTPSAIRTALCRYFEGDIDALSSLPTHAVGTEFQQKVWSALREIPPGTTTSYGALARRIGSPGASRAVGLANGSNPIGLVVPCHRVIGANGTLTGYGGGLERKRWLLDHERRWIDAKITR